MRARLPPPLAAGAAPAVVDPGFSRAAEAARTGLKPLDVTIRVFDPTRSPDEGQGDLPPVDGPDEERAIASTIANAAPSTTKVDGGRPRPVAFTRIRVEPWP